MRDEQQIVALRDEIRRTGKRIDGFRCLVYGFITVPLVSVVVSVTTHGVQLPPEFIAAWVGIGALFLRFAVASRARSRNRLRRRLIDLPEAQRVEVLRTLARDDLPDTRRIAQPLLREIGVPLEMSPAVSSAAARGNEASPAEQPHAAQLDE